MIKCASLKPEVQMVSFGRFLHWSLYLTPKKWPNHHLTPSLNRPKVLVVLSSGLIPMDTTFSSNSTLMVLEPLMASVHQFYLPSSLVTTTPSIFNGPSRSANGSAEHMDENNAAWSRPGLQGTHNLNKNRNCDNHQQHLYSSL